MLFFGFLTTPKNQKDAKAGAIKSAGLNPMMVNKINPLNLINPKAH